MFFLHFPDDTKDWTANKIQLTLWTFYLGKQLNPELFMEEKTVNNSQSGQGKTKPYSDTRIGDAVQEDKVRKVRKPEDETKRRLPLKRKRKS